jgi:hypothetical protein
MSDFADTMSTIESIIGFGLRLVGNGFEILDVLIIIGGVVLTIDYVLRGLRNHISDDAYGSVWKILVVADIVKSIANNLTFMSLGLPAALIVVRTFLSWTLVLEIDGRSPWQPISFVCRRRIRRLHAEIVLGGGPRLLDCGGVTEAVAHHIHVRLGKHTGDS